MRDPAIGLAASLLILVFLVAIGSATAITDQHIEQGVRQNFAAAELRWPVTRRHVFTPGPSALYTQVGWHSGDARQPRLPAPAPIERRGPTPKERVA